MNTILGTLSIAASMAFTPVSMAQVSDAHPISTGGPNAALEYWKIWETMDSELVDLVFDAEEAKGSEEGSSALDALLQLQPEIQSLIRASEMPLCDWQIDYSAGFETVLPHLGKVRVSAKLLNADARRLIDEDEIEAASVRAVAIFGIASHVNEDNFLIGSLVSMVVADLGCTLVDEILDTGKSTPADRDMMLAALNQFERVDPFYVADAIALEREIAVDWIKREFTGEDAREVSELIEYVTGNDALSENHPFVDYSDEDLVRDLDKLSAAYDALLGVWNADDVLDQFDAIHDRVRAGEFGELAKVLLPALGSVRQRSSGMDATLKSTRNRLSEESDQAAESTKNPGTDSDG
jgi:hypothetical protein